MIKIINVYACKLPLQTLVLKKINWKQISDIGICVSKYNRKQLLDQYRSYYAYLLLDNVLNSIGEFKGSYITTNKYGRPILTNHNINYKTIDFNISHSGHWIVLAISDKKIGIDIEEILPINLDDLVPFIFDDDQVRYFWENGQEPREQLKAFYSKWVQIESYLKMVGTGLYGLQKGGPVIWKNNNGIYQKEYNIEEEYKMAISSVSLDLPNNIIFKDYFEISNE
ncbi:4'-phosphopantetheinyl transferase family protein [Rummeliibacillus suwonensis]|uniref:4'-phosphopantetheinyl transferase family protein n=1 Tax=Rummeliibacillus suwonensis TaxID=1306154 RepID=UPI0011B43A5B|nr:4'-phosphopantetheinyl transferase superfamily protein [Rummeliibacillus suwonensis]